jgi:hypothetical protein
VRLHAISQGATVENVATSLATLAYCVLLVYFLSRKPVKQAVGEARE